MSRARQLIDRGNNHSILLDSSAADTDVGERLVLNGTDPFIELEDSGLGDNKSLLLLNGTDGDSSDAGSSVNVDGYTGSNNGFSILQEDGTDNPDVRITSQLENGIFNFTSVPKNDNNPAFYVTTLTDDTNAEIAYSKILFDVVHFDTINGWDLTNYQYNPSVAGYYHFYMQWAEYSNSDVYDILGGIGKGSDVIANSSATSCHGRKRLAGFSTFDWYASTVYTETILFMNGDDDFVRAWAWGNSSQGSTVKLQGNGRATFFGGHLITRRDSSAFLDFTSGDKNYNQ